MITLNAEKFIEILNQKGYDYRQEGETIIIESSGINNSEGSFLLLMSLIEWISILLLGTMGGLLWIRY